MADAPRLILFAGVNGAGKSTLYRCGMWADDEGDLALPRVNPDEIIREHGWDWAKAADQMAAGKIARSQIEGYLKARLSFNQETTLSGRSIVRNIRRAAESGYDIHVKYVGVDSPQTAISRIQHRVSIGGHDIDSASVQRRYAASRKNLIAVFPSCKTVSFFDNTNTLNMVAYADQDAIIDFYHNRPIADWYKDILTELQSLLQS